MGSRGPAAKNKKRQGDNVERAIVPLNKEVIVLPDPPAEASETVKQAWKIYAASNVARVVDAVDVPLLVRWAFAYDEWLSTMTLVRAEGPFAPGSKGQPVVSPAVKYLNEIEAKLARFETQLGMTPMARARLGLTIAEGHLTAAHLNDMVKKPGIADPDTGADGDDVADVIDLKGWEPAE